MAPVRKKIMHVKKSSASEFYKANPACTHRLIPWLLRDLRVLLGNSEEEVNFLMEFILSLITRLDMDSSEFIEELRPFLLQTTEHFVHELLSFAKAPFDVNAYDECVVYPWPDDNNRVNVPGTTADISEERTGQFSQVELSELGEETSLALFDWSETPIEVRNKPGENESLTQVLTNENVEPSTISARETPVADGGKSHFTLTTRNNTSVSDVESQTVETSKRTLRDEGSSLEGLGNSVNGINDSVPGICVDNINLDSVQKNSSAENFHEHKHKRHKQTRHKRKHKHERTRSNHKSTALEKAREEKTSSRGNCLSVGMSNNVVEREEWIISLSSGYQTEEQPRSPTLEEMLKEISDLNARIDEHEQKLLSLDECAKR